MGMIITNIKNIVMWSVATEYTRIDGSFTMGMEFGQIIWMILYPAEVYLDQAIADENNVWG